MCFNDLVVKLAEMLDGLKRQHLIEFYDRHFLPESEDRRKVSIQIGPANQPIPPGLDLYDSEVGLDSLSSNNEFLCRAWDDPADLGAMRSMHNMWDLQETIEDLSLTLD